MKPMLAVAALACMSRAAAVSAQARSSTAQTEIQSLMDEQMQAANAHDTDRFLATYLHDSTLVFVFNGAVMRGFTALRAAQLKAWNSGQTDVAYSVRGPSDFAPLTPGITVVTEQLSSRRTLPSGEVKTNDLTVTMVWQKRPEGWRIVQAHESTVH
jgi:uncharacterized protein (TIGR02246 family)